MDAFLVDVSQEGRRLAGADVRGDDGGCISPPWLVPRLLLLLVLSDVPPYRSSSVRIRQEDLNTRFLYLRESDQRAGA